MEKENTIHISISRLANEFVFLGTLSNTRTSEWDKERKREWIKNTGKELTSLELEHKEKISHLFSSISYDLVEAHFFAFSEKDVWKNLKQYISPKDIRTIKIAMRIFEPRFLKIWKNKNKKLKILNHELLKHKKKIIEGKKYIDCLCGVENLSQFPSVHLVIGSFHKNDYSGWCSRFDTRVDIILECTSSLSLKKINFLNMILLHEYIHHTLHISKKNEQLISRYASTYQKILSTISKEMPRELVLEEMIVSSIIPEGYLGTFLFKNNLCSTSTVYKNGKINFLLMRKYIGKSMSAELKEYIEQKKNIDEKYILSVIKKLGGI